MKNKRFTFRVWTGSEMIYFKLGDNLPTNWSYWETCMQNTSLLDKNGKEIYEGDIVAHMVHDYLGKDENGNHINGELVESYRSVIKWWPDMVNVEKAIIIGNIYENSELLS